MKIAVCSDIHGNTEALTAVLSDIRQVGVDKIICLGDIVGYGAEPGICCELIRGAAEQVVIGNHDAAVAGRMDYSYYYEAARDALDWCRGTVGRENLRWLKQLPYRYEDKPNGLCFTHGNPRDPEAFDYIFALEQARELIPVVDSLAHLSFIGHSHLTKIFALGAPEGGKIEAFDIIADSVCLEPDYRYIITVGSVGQPRDYDPRACYGLLDLEARRFEYRRVEYDIDSAAQKIFDAGLSRDFGRRLYLGW